MYKNRDMKEELLNLIESKAPGSKPLYLVVRGSHSYGTNIETSDVDYSGVFIQPLEDILGNKYVEQINDDKNDIVIYELRRFLEMCAINNPNILELLNTPEDCVVYKDPIFDEILANKESFITKQCGNTLGGYAKTQIGKARGLNKKQNWEMDKVTRKDILDFCYVIENEKSIPWKKWNEDKEYDEKFIGAVNIPNARDTYALFYDMLSSNLFGNEPMENGDLLIERLKLEGKALGLGYKGLVKVGSTTFSRDPLTTNMSEEELVRLEKHFENEANKNLGISNQLRLSSIPKGEKSICTIVYNKDGYSQHCKDFREYEEWLTKRNVQRYVDVKNHNQKVDGKNLMHCFRLVGMSREIAEGKGVIVRRDNAAELLSIRRGEVDLNTLIERVEKEIIEIDELYKTCDLPEKVDKELINSLIIKIRKEVYGL